MREQSWIKTALKQRGYKLKDAADRLGITPPRVTDIIKGMREVQADEILPLSDMLGISPTRLLRSLEIGSFAADDQFTAPDRLEILGRLYGDGRVVTETGLSYSTVALPPDAARSEGLSCYMVGDASMSEDVDEGSLIIAADPKLHVFPMTHGGLVLFRVDEAIYLRRIHITASGEHWLVPTPRDPDPQLKSFQLSVADDLSPASTDMEAPPTETVHTRDIFAGVLWVHQNRKPA